VLPVSFEWSVDTRGLPAILVLMFTASLKVCNLYILRKWSSICVQVQRELLDMTAKVWAEKGHGHLLNSKRELKPIHCHCRTVGVDVIKFFCEYQNNISAIKSDFLDSESYVYCAVHHLDS